MKLKLFKITFMIFKAKNWDKKPCIENHGFNCFLKRYLIYIYI